ncbi:MAG: LCP family protein [Clostridia bacterium]|nr:LCP family protein [Clostridia bacterium]
MAERKKHTASAHSAKPSKDIKPKGRKRGSEEEEILLSEIGGKKKRLSTGKKVLIIVLCFVIVLVSAVVINPFNWLERTGWFYNYDYLKDDELGALPTIDEGVVNIALFGLDTRKKDVFEGLSDSIMILSIDTNAKTVKIVSVMRDTFVPINYKSGKKGYGKINSAYADDRVTAIRTLNDVFGLDIREYATVNFFGMAEIIDAVGGIDIEVTADELKWKGNGNPNLNGCMDEICAELKKDAKKYYITTTGKHHANGIQAVAYSRVRHCRSIWGTNDDYGRTDRQRYVMEQLFNKAVKIDSSEYAGLVKALRPCTKTSLEIKKILALAQSVLKEHPTFEQVRFPQNDWELSVKPKGYGSVVYYDLGFAKKALHAFLYDGITVEDYVKQNGVGRNNWFGASGKSTTSESDTVSSTVSDPSDTSSDTPDTSEPVDGDDNSGSHEDGAGGNTDTGDGGNTGDGGSGEGSGEGGSGDSGEGGSGDSGGENAGNEGGET